MRILKGAPRRVNNERDQHCDSDEWLYPPLVGTQVARGYLGAAWGRDRPAHKESHRFRLCLKVEVH